MKKVYIACPISKYVRQGFSKDYIDTMNKIYSICEKNSDVYFPLKEEAYGSDKTKGGGDVCTPIDFEKVTNADFIIAIPEVSMGVSVELGWASANNKKILLFIDDNYHQSEIIRFLNTITPATLIKINTSEGYKNMQNLMCDAVKKFLNK